MERVKSVAVIGAGPAGLTAAYSLLKSGLEVDVYEASTAVGGMSKTIPMWDQLVDLGPHRFLSSDPRVNRLWLEMVGRDYTMVNRLSRIFYKGAFFSYPLSAFNVLKGLGLYEASRCMASYFVSKVSKSGDMSTFEGWVSSRFGSRLYEIFFKSYSEKLWGIPCKQLSADFAAQRIKKLSLFEAVKSAFVGSHGLKHKTLADEFAYPDLGTGVVYDRMAAKIEKMGGRIHFRSPVEAIDHNSDKAGVFIKFADGTTRRFDHVVSTMPITQLVASLDGPAEVLAHAQALRFRNTILVYLLLQGPNPFPDQWIYIHSTNLKTGRITNFRNWSRSINCGKPDTILCLEYWCYDHDAIWSATSPDLVSLATKEVHQSGLVEQSCVREGKVIRVPKCYPVYAVGYKTHLKPIEEYLSGLKKISVIGRYGAFKYNNQDHSILMGLLAADNIANGTNHDLWALNTDYEYQESSRITATGLAKS